MIWLCGVCDTDLETRKELRPGLNINIHTRNKLDQNPKLESIILPRKHIYTNGALHVRDSFLASSLDSFAANALKIFV